MTYTDEKKVGEGFVFSESDGGGSSPTSVQADKAEIFVLNAVCKS
jgi:hypothetical protein